KINSNSVNASSAAGFKSDINNTIAAAGLSLGLGGTRQFTNTIGRTFGLDSLTLDAEGVGDDTQVSLTGYITPDLYLRYGVGVFTPVNRLTLRYQLNRRLYVEASSALDRAIDVFYNWRF
ncbi:translocation/assembly module TamB domain-containing protein, partial [Rhizobium hidalgonense]